MSDRDTIVTIAREVIGAWESVPEWVIESGAIDHMRHHINALRDAVTNLDEAAWRAETPGSIADALPWLFRRPPGIARKPNGARCGELAVATDGYGLLAVAGVEPDWIDLDEAGVKALIEDRGDLVGAATREDIRAWLDADKPLDRHTPIVALGDKQLDASLLETWLWSAARLESAEIRVYVGREKPTVHFVGNGWMTIAAPGLFEPDPSVPPPSLSLREVCDE